MADGTFTLPKWKNVDNKVHVQGLYTPSTTYLTATPSEWVLLTALGLKKVERIYRPSHDILDPSVLLTIATQKRGFDVTFVDPVVTAGKAELRLWETSGTELADAQNASSRTFYIVFVGT